MSWPSESIHRMVDGRFRHAFSDPPLAIMTLPSPHLLQNGEGSVASSRRIAA
jgi:hypothetical protein